MWRWTPTDPVADLNFLLHRHLAERDLGDRANGRIAGIGSMLPDFWRMAHRRVRPRHGVDPPSDASPELTALLEGVQHHLRADDWFHKHPVFIEGEKRLAQRFRKAEIAAEKIGLFAHIGWELCLDGALLRKVGVEETLGELRRGLDEARAELSATAELHASHAGSRVPDGFHDRLESLLERVAWSDWVPGYTNGEGVARRLGGVRRRVRLAPFTSDDLERLGRVFDESLEEAELAVRSFLSTWSPTG